MYLRGGGGLGHARHRSYNTSDGCEAASLRDNYETGEDLQRKHLSLLYVTALLLLEKSIAGTEAQ
jgi:hypothetical protein